MLIKKDRDNTTKRINRKKLLIIPGVLVGVAAVVYIAGAVYYRSHFFKGTNIYGTDVSKMKIEDFKDKLSDYKIQVEQKDKEGNKFTEELSVEDLGVDVASTQELERILDSQNIWRWPFNNSTVYCGGGTLISYDADKTETAVSGLKCLQEEQVQKRKNAYISEYKSGEGYSIVPEIDGNQLDYERTLEVIEAAIINLDTKIDLDAEDCYKKARITSDNESLNRKLDKMNKYVSTVVTYEFGDNTEILDGETINKWISLEDGKVVFDENGVSEYVATLRRKYDTIFRSREFKTSYGKTITIEGGDYGWWMNTGEETKELTELIKKGKVVKRTPCYYQTAQSYGEKDYGDTYVEINLTAQHVFLYKDGKKILETDCVSGNSARGFDTPTGVYGITYTERNATLNGENYSTPVSYWMPFNKNVGLHDAGWRSSFGGQIYKTNGSHGCVNLPPSAAKAIFSYVSKGTPVVCYTLPGTETGLKPSPSPSGTPAQAGSAAPTAQPQ